MESKLFVTISASIIGILTALIVSIFYGSPWPGIVVALAAGAGAYFFTKVYRWVAGKFK